MENYVQVGNFQVASVLYDFIKEEAILGTEINLDEFWAGFENLVNDLASENEGLLTTREKMQTQINEWHQKHKGQYQFENYKLFLQSIGYLEKEIADYEITTEDVDDEITLQAGPQLVVPVNNARYAINAANARWGSLYDALYGTDVISEQGDAGQGNAYNPVRGEKVIAYGKEFLDQSVPLEEGSHRDVKLYKIFAGQLCVELQDGKLTSLKNKQQFIGFQGQLSNPQAILLQNNGLHLEIQIDDTHPIGQTDQAGVKDIVLESALTTIMDFEDSVAAVDAEDKVEVYRNWLGLMKGDLSATFQKGNSKVMRTLNGDRSYHSASGTSFSLPGRSLLFVRNVGHLMTNNAVLYEGGKEIPEGILDGVITGLISLHDLRRNGQYKNSKKGSVYIVKPKMHGSKEVAFANKLFNRIEDLLGLERNTLKIGVMDEERRTSLNLKNCIEKVKERIVFINTGFLDRTGDEIHTSMEAGPVVRKNEMKSSIWLQAYEKSNVATGVNAGLPGRAQIGKGMWAMPDLMSDMVEQKISHLKAGANTAWVPSPTAATLHALHYHQLNVTEVQKQIMPEKEEALRDCLLQLPLADEQNWSTEEIQQELENNSQSILGYVVRWVEQGVGCSKVPDINNVGLMEDRATLRISSQQLANWIHHQICTEEQVLETMKKMAKVVDEQNIGDPDYRTMSNDYENSVAFQAACDLVFQGCAQPSGYTEPILHKRRIEAKSKVKVGTNR